MSNQDEADLEKFISHDEKTNISQCLVPDCHTVFIGKKKLDIKRHYRIAHDSDIEEYENTADMLNIHKANIHNNVDVGESNPLVTYSIKYINDNTKNKSKSNNVSHDSSDDKGYRKFLLADYVEYCKQTNISKCLIKNCERPMSGRRTGNIRRHYHKVHNFIIVHDNQETIRAMKKELTAYYNNDTFGDSTFDDENEDEMSDASEHNVYLTINFDQYIEYDPLINKSLCKVPGCKTYLEGRKLLSIKRHFGMVHNYDIESNGSKVYNNSMYLKLRNDPLQNMFIICIEDLVVYDKKSSSYQCLFINCNDTLEKHLPSLKRHYHEIHKIIIGKFLDNIPHRLYRKRNAHNSYVHHYESEFSRDDEYVDETASFVKNEVLSDDENPHCSKRQCSNLTYMKETDSYSTKKENISENIHQKPSKIEITMTKLEFLKLCFNLVIERSLNINIFDDETLFKKLLAPFEEAFCCKVNSTLIESLMIKANNIVVRCLKDKFANKIVCLELHVVNFEKEYYLAFNIRFLNEQTICNAVIGFLPITKTGTDILPIFECLSKFNIEQQQVYMITIIGGLLDDEEINNICNNLCKKNPDIKNHPICYIQTVLRSFVHKYSEDIKSWQELVNYDCKLNTDVFNNLKEFANYMEKLSETDIDLNPQIKEANYFLKSLQILRNFIEKLTEEQYVTGDFYRDWLCCELELKDELTKNYNAYAGKLYEDLTEWKTALLQSNEFVAALYLDPRFNFLSSRLLSDAQKTNGKLFLCSTWEKFKKYIQHANISAVQLHINTDSNNDVNDDKYALLNEHINDMQVKSSVALEDIITNCISAKREPFSLDILKYWYCKGKDMKDINELTKIVFTFSSSQYISIYLQKNFVVSHKEIDKFDKFLIKNNQDILEKNIDLIFKDLQ